MLFTSLLALGAGEKLLLAFAAGAGTALATSKK